MSNEIENKKISFKEILISLACIGMCIFHLYTAVFGVFPITIQRSAHMTFVVFLVFMVKSSKSKIGQIFDYIFCILATSSAAYVWLSYDRFSQRIQYVSPVTVMDKIMCCIMIAMVLANLGPLHWEPRVLAT